MKQPSLNVFVKAHDQAVDKLSVKKYEDPRIFCLCMNDLLTLYKRYFIMFTNKIDEF